MQRDLQTEQGGPALGARSAALAAVGFVGLVCTGSVWGFLPGQRPPAPHQDTVTRADTDLIRFPDTAPRADDEALGFGLSDMLEPDLRSHAGQLDAMVAAALQQGHSAVYIDTLVNEAARRGQIVIPPEFVTAEGRADTATLLSLLSGQRPTPYDKGPEAGFYIVQPGDSMAAIAYRYYGETSLSQEIFRANSQQLTPPARLTAGLRLIMPAL